MKAPPHDAPQAASASRDLSRLTGHFMRILLYGTLIVFSILTLIPFAWLAVGSLKVNADFFAFLFFPAGDGPMGIAWDRLTLTHFHTLFARLGFFNALMNSLFLASLTSIIATLFAALGGFALSKYRFRGRSTITALVLAALIIPAPLLLAPVYQLLYRLDLLNSYSGLILPAAAPAFGIFLFRQSMLNNIPRELLEAARIDGCSEIRIFFQIVLPISRPMIGAFLLITFLNTWNNYISPQIILQDSTLFPLSVAISQLRGLYISEYGLISAGTIVSIAPLMLVFLLLQKSFISGLTSGAVKG
jgi:ABC-type glycerol-3-phosphate transport system permease component